MGAGNTQVLAGGVEGWSWGTGTVSEGTEPPVRTFDQLCSAVLATATPTTAPPTLTATSQPTNTATETPRPSATATTAPTNTPAPTGTLIPMATPSQAGASTVIPTETGEATSIPTATQAPPTTTRPVATSAPPPPINTVTATPAPTEVSTATQPPTPSQEGESPIQVTEESVVIPDATPATNAIPTLAAPSVNAPTPTVIGIALQPTLPPAATGANPPLVAADADEGESGFGDGWIYGVFGVIVLGLAGVVGWVWYQQRGG
jgi:hypothetical protein